MEGDHVIRWQVLDQLTGGSKEDIHFERMMIELEGWGKELLDLQDENGLWEQSVIHNQYKSTLWVLIRFRRFGIYPLDFFYLPCEKLMNELTFDGGILWEGTDKKHTCLAGLALMVLSYFRYVPPQIEAIYHFLIETQQEDGSWLCEHHDDKETGVFATTLAVLEGLLEYQKIFREEHNRIADMQTDAHEFLLRHHLHKISPDSKELYESFSEFNFPYLGYDLLTVLDYFRERDAVYDPRMQEAFDIVKAAQWNERWSLPPQSQNTHITLEADEEHNRFNTLRAVRVLNYFGQ